LSELDPTGFERLEHPVEDAAVVLQWRLSAAPKRARGKASGLRWRRCASTTRRRMCSTAPAANTGGAGAVLDEFAEGR